MAYVYHSKSLYFSGMLGLQIVLCRLAPCLQIVLCRRGFHPPGKRLLDAIQGCIPSLATFAANLFAGDKPRTLGYIRCEFVPMDKPE